MFWKRVAHQLDVLSLKYVDLWRTLKVSSNTGTGWVAKDRTPPVATCLAIAKVLGVSVSYLVTGEETELPDDDYVRKPEPVVHENKHQFVKTQDRTLPPDLLKALLSCTDKQMKLVRQVLELTEE